MNVHENNFASENGHARIRHDWTREEIARLFQLAFNDLIFKAQSVHRAFFDPSKIQLSTLLSIKTGGCPEDCSYCPQSSHYDTGLNASKLLDVRTVVDAAMRAKSSGSTRFCMGAAWRSPKDRDMTAICELVKEVKQLGLETCMTLGMLTQTQAGRLGEAGLDYYNHNLDSSPEFYSKIISTRTWEERIETLNNVRDAGINVCSGGIVGMGETSEDRAGMIHALATLPEHPESVPINLLVRSPGTPLENSDLVPSFDFVRVIAVARICMPASIIRLSAGRTSMTDEMQALCILAGANSFFSGDQLLTTPNPESAKDFSLLTQLGMQPDATAGRF